MTVILSEPSDRPGKTFAGTQYWRYTGFRDASNYLLRNPGLPQPVIGLRFDGWVNQQAFESLAEVNDQYELQLTFEQFLAVIAPVISSGGIDFVDPIEQILITKPGFTSGSIVALI